MLLALLNFAGVVSVTIFLSLTEVPMTIFLTDTKARKAMLNPLVKKHTYRKAGAFGLWRLGMGFLGMFCLMHASNYKPEDHPGQEAARSGHQRGLYLVLLLGFGGYWLLGCIRAWIVVPDTRSNAVAETPPHISPRARLKPPR